MRRGSRMKKRDDVEKNAFEFSRTGTKQIL